MAPVRKVGRVLASILAFGTLFGVAVPWYWSAAGLPEDRLMIGVPLWFFVAVSGSVLISLLAAWILRTPWPAELDALEEDGES